MKYKGKTKPESLRITSYLFQYLEVWCNSIRSQQEVLRTSGGGNLTAADADRHRYVVLVTNTSVTAIRDLIPKGGEQLLVKVNRSW